MTRRKILEVLPGMVQSSGSSAGTAQIVIDVDFLNGGIRSSKLTIGMKLL
jgi:hypothetical protein